MPNIRRIINYTKRTLNQGRGFDSQPEDLEFHCSKLVPVGGVFLAKQAALHKMSSNMLFYMLIVIVVMITLTITHSFFL